MAPGNREEEKGGCNKRGTSFFLTWTFRAVVGLLNLLELRVQISALGKTLGTGQPLKGHK